MSKSILIPVESSRIAESAATIELAKRYGDENSKINLLNVFEEIPTWAATNLPKDVINNSLHEIDTELQAVADAAGSNVNAMVRVGHIYKTILEVANETDADLIIVASNQPDTHSFYLGSTAARVVRHARCSVLVLR